MGNDEPLLPPPPLASPSAIPDFPASAAMVNDILSVAPADGRSEDPPTRQVADGADLKTPTSASLPLSSDFFTTRKKKRFRHSK